MKTALADFPDFKTVRQSAFAAGAFLLSLFVGCGNQAEKTPDDPQAKTAARKSAPRPTPKPDIARKRPTGTLPRFTECAKSLGIVFNRYDDQTGLHRIMEANGGGVAILDYDSNGFPDIFFTNGCRLPLKTADRSHPSEFIASIDGTKFERVTNETGVLPFGYASGCAVGDYDGDGFDDLYIAAYGPNSLWRNNGDGTFSNVTDEAGVQFPKWSTSPAFADVNRDGILDLYVVNYIQAADDPPQLCPAPKSPDGYVQCPPTRFHAENDVLLLGDGQGGFVDATRQAGITAVDGKGLGIVVFDANGDGWPDIYVANDGMPNFLYLNVTAEQEKPATGKPFAKFQEMAALKGVALNHEGTAEASMGVAAGDVDGDGWTDLLLTHFYAETNTFYRNLNGQGFADESSRSKLGPPSRSKLGFGTLFLDYENDGRLDLFITNGHIDDFTYVNSGEEFQMTPQFFRNSGDARFENVSDFCGDYFRQKWLGRGVASADLDRDGNVDLVISHQRAPSAVLRNETPTKYRSVQLTLIGTGRSNRSAYGTRIEAEGFPNRLVREVMGGTSFQSASSREIHIGLGDRKTISRIRISWPSGKTQDIHDLKAGQYIVVEGLAARFNPQQRGDAKTSERGQVVGCD